MVYATNDLDVGPSRLPDKKTEQTRHMVVPFSVDERDEVAVELAREVRKARDIEAEKSRVNSEYNSQIKEHKEEAQRLADDHARGGKMGDVKTVRWYYYAENLVVEFRADTGEIIESRELRPGERQLSIPAAVRRTGLLGPYTRRHPILGELDSDPWCVKLHTPCPPSRPGVPK